jgi:uracil permease
MWGVSVALVTMLSIAVISHYAKGLWRILPFLVGTLIGYVYAIILTLSGAYQIVDFSVFANLKLFNVPDFAFLHWTSVSFTTLLPIIIIYVAYTISAIMECLTDHAA